jgi:hypothetical protein
MESGQTPNAILSAGLLGRYCLTNCLCLDESLNRPAGAASPLRLPQGRVNLSTSPTLALATSSA